MADDAKPLTPYEKFVEATKRILSVPKKDVEKAMRQLRQKRAQKRKRGRR